jgi:large subunit ribosomal protein L18
VIRIKTYKKTSTKVTKRLKNKARIRKKVRGTGERPRLAVFRSGRHMYAQIVDDQTGTTLVAASSVALKAKEAGKKSDLAKSVGAAVAKKAIEKNIKDVVFDRSGYVFHGRVKAVADGAREAGLNF